MTMQPCGQPLRIGVVGLGRAFTLMLPTLASDPRVRLVAAADPRAPARDLFVHDFAGRAFDSVEQLCEMPDVEVAYVASPHQFHADQVCRLAAAGKHILVEKPLAISLDECTRIVEAVEAAGVILVVGPSHSFDGPVGQTRRMLAAGDLGRVRMVHAFNYTTFLYRPRRPEELMTAKGGGVVFSQAAHQVDIVRLLGGGRVKSVRGLVGAWDPARPTEGAYSALLRFDGGAFGSLTYSGYAHYDSDELLGNIDEFGRDKTADSYGSVRRHLQSVGDSASEARIKTDTSYGGSHYRPHTGPVARHHPHFGHLLVSTDRVDLRVTPDGVWVYSDDQRHFCATPLQAVPRSEVIDELWDSVRLGRPPVHGARWGRATTEVCLGVLESARTGSDVAMRFQVRP